MDGTLITEVSPLVNRFSFSVLRSTVALPEAVSTLTGLVFLSVPAPETAASYVFEVFEKLLLLLQPVLLLLTNTFRQATLISMLSGIAWKTGRELLEQRRAIKQLPTLLEQGG